MFSLTLILTSPSCVYLTRVESMEEAGKMKRHQLMGEHLYEGVPYPVDFPPQLLHRVQHDFQLRDDDIMIATYPKSGTTWMQEIIWLIMNNVDVSKAKEEFLDDRFPFLEIDGYGRKGPLSIDLLEEASSPRLIKTHQPFHFFSDQLRKKKTKLILGIRNVKDTLVSYYHFYRMNVTFGHLKGPFSEFFELFKERHLVFGDWFDNNLGYWHNRHDYNFFLLKYEDLHKDFRGTVRKVAEFLEREVSDSQIDAIAKHVAFGSMKSNDKVNQSCFDCMDFNVSHFMRKGKVGDWKNYFTADMNEYMDKLYREKMEGTGLYLDFELP